MLLILDFSININICKLIVHFLSQLHFILHILAYIILHILEYMEFKICFTMPWQVIINHENALFFIINILYVQFSVWDWT